MSSCKKPCPAMLLAGEVRACGQLGTGAPSKAPQPMVCLHPFSGVLSPFSGPFSGLLGEASAPSAEPQRPQQRPSCPGHCSWLPHSLPEVLTLALVTTA